MLHLNIRSFRFTLHVPLDFTIPQQSFEGCCEARLGEDYDMLQP